MRTAVYTITKNEEQFIARWAESAQNADVRLVVDTGSTDRTVDFARKAGCQVAEIRITPWRFDDARNAALALLPSDVHFCVALDADEVLIPGWYEALDALAPHVTRPSYEYTWSWIKEGEIPGVMYAGDKIHTRWGYRWRHPVHEVLTPVDAAVEIREWCDLKIHHYPDHSKSRSSYLPLLELAVREDPTDDRNAHYLAREYFYRGELDKAAAEFQRHLSLPKATWAPERAKSMRLLADCVPEREVWLLRSVAEDPTSRESWIALAQLYYEQSDWPGCFAASSRALTLTHRHLSYISEGWAWGPLPYDLNAISAHHLGLQDVAVRNGEIALSLSPDDERLKANLGFYLTRK